MFAPPFLKILGTILGMSFSTPGFKHRDIVLGINQICFLLVLMDQVEIPFPESILDLCLQMREKYEVGKQ